MFRLECDDHGVRSEAKNRLVHIFIKTHGKMPGQFSVSFLNFIIGGFIQILEQTMIFGNLGSSSRGNLKSFE
jgi:hypothetical protein